MLFVALIYGFPDIFIRLVELTGKDDKTSFVYCNIFVIYRSSGSKAG